MSDQFTESEVFGIDPSEFYTMSAEDRLRITRAAASLSFGLVNQTFDGSTVDWIVIGHVPPRVIASGNYGEDPSDAELDKMSVDHDVVPYFYSRPETLSS